jgi:thiol-disulfide isomerase/thioredoxin
MSSPALSDSQVLRAFTAAYNDKFRELMQASDPAPSPALSGCSACRSMGDARPTVVEVVEASVPITTTKSAGQGGGAFWTVVLVLAGLAILFLLGSQLCKAKSRVVLAGTPLSVEASMGGGSAGSSSRGGVIKDISDPSQAVPTSGRAIVMYHATWCGHCKQMRPMYESAAAAAASQQLAFLACEHEVLEKSGKGQQLGIQGYPTLIAFDSGSKKGELVGNVGADKLKAFIGQFAGK